MKNKDKLMRSILLQRRKFGVPNLHVGGYYVLQNGSVAVAVEPIYPDANQGQGGTASFMALMMGGQKEQKDKGDDWKVPHVDPKGWGLSIVESTDPQYRCGAGFMIDAEADCDYLDLTPINEVEIEFVKMILPNNKLDTGTDL